MGVDNAQIWCTNDRIWRLPWFVKLSDAGCTNSCLRRRSKASSAGLARPGVGMMVAAAACDSCVRRGGQDVWVARNDTE